MQGLQVDTGPNPPAAVAHPAALRLLPSHCAPEKDLDIDPYFVSLPQCRKAAVAVEAVLIKCRGTRVNSLKLL